MSGNFNGIKIWIHKYGNKIIDCHLKDFYSKDVDFQDHAQQSSIGEGFVDWPNVLSELKKTNCKVFALEHDDPKDYKEYILKSLDYLTSIE